MKSAAVAILLLAGCSRQPVPTIIHVVDYHFVPRDDFTANLRDQTFHQIKDGEIDRQYAEFLDTVESVQVEQAAILRRLMQEHGVRQVFIELLTAEKVAAFRQSVDDLRQVDFDQVHQHVKNESFDSDARAALQESINTLRCRRLELGAVGQLMLANEPIDIAPLDDARMLQNADPEENGFRFGGEGNAKRERAWVKRLLVAGPVVVCIVGGGHDLESEVKAQNPRARYLRIETEAGRRGDRN